MHYSRRCQGQLKQLDRLWFIFIVQPLIELKHSMTSIIDKIDLLYSALSVSPSTTLAIL